ncbi:hypothetical protein BGW41_008291 [Actinomortierella wolfii]|nr:hypothetical protein BGW41_008291 [Actinomortierella wolfii]
MANKDVTASVEVNVEVTTHDAPHDDVPPKAEEVKKTDAAATDAADGDAAAESDSDESLLDIEAGYLHKKGTNPINPWNKRYFVFGDAPLPITNLQSLHKRNERRPVVKASASAAPAPAPAAAAADAEGEAAAEGSADSASAKDKAVASKKVTVEVPPKEKTKDVYESANKDLLVNIAHATQTGKGLLFYHKSDNSTHVANPLGVINLRDVNAVEKIEKSSKGHSFVVKTKSRDYHFAAGSDKEAKSWVKAIQAKSNDAKASQDPYDSPQFQQVYQKLVAREAFEHAKNSASILSDNEPMSDGEPEDIEVDKEGKPLVKKRKSFFNFSVAATSNEKRKADGITTEVKTEEKKDLMHVQDDGIDAFKAAESNKAVSHSTDAPTTAKGDPLPPTPPKSPTKAKASGGGFKLFGGGKKKEEAPAPTTPPAEQPQPLTVEGAKAAALKAVDEAVEASKAKTEEVTNGVPATPPPPEKKLSFFEKLFAKKPVAPPPPPPPVHEETVVVSSENHVANVVTETGVAHTESNAGFFSKLTQDGDKKEVEVKSAEVASENLQTKDGEASFVQRIQGTDADAKEGEVNLSTVDNTIESSDKPEKEKVVVRKPSVLKRLGDAVGLTKALEAPKAEEEEEAKADESSAKTETPTVTEEDTEDKVKDVAIAEAPKEETVAA